METSHRNPPITRERSEWTSEASQVRWGISKQRKKQIHQAPLHERIIVSENVRFLYPTESIEVNAVGMHMQGIVRAGRRRL
jgi:hypothetical protein